MPEKALNVQLLFLRDVFNVYRKNMIYCVRDLFSHEEGAISIFSMDQKMRAHLCFVVFLYV